MNRPQVPPSPKGLPLIGHALAFASDPLSFLTRCARECGDVVRLGEPGKTLRLVPAITLRPASGMRARAALHGAKRIPSRVQSA